MTTRAAARLGWGGLASPTLLAVLAIDGPEVSDLFDSKP
jgi:hypothetical protein